MNNSTNQPQSQDQRAEGFHPSTPAAHQKADEFDRISAELDKVIEARKAKRLESHGEEQARAQLESILEMVKELDGDNSDIAYEAIQDDPLSVQVRTGWYTPGQEAEPEEFEILLCTGGPAVRIVGDLDRYKQPANAYIEYQDWGTPWTELRHSESDAVLTYCQQFYYGD